MGADKRGQIEVFGRKITHWFGKLKNSSENTGKWFRGTEIQQVNARDTWVWGAKCSISTLHVLCISGDLPTLNLGVLRTAPTIPGSMCGMTASCYTILRVWRDVVPIAAEVRRWSWNWRKRNAKNKKASRWTKIMRLIKNLERFWCQNVNWYTLMWCFIDLDTRLQCLASPWRVPRSAKLRTWEWSKSFYVHSHLAGQFMNNVCIINRYTYIYIYILMISYD